MATHIKVLASGTKSTTTAETVYTATSPKTAMVTAIVLDSAGAVTVEAQAGSASTFYTCAKMVFSGAASDSLQDPITLGPGEAIRLALSAAGTVAYSVMGIERD